MMGEASLRVGTGQNSDRKRPRKETTSNPNQQSPSPSTRPNANLPSQPNPTHNQSEHHTHPHPSVRCCSAGGSLSEIPSRLTWAPLNGGYGARQPLRTYCNVFFLCGMMLLLSWEGQNGLQNPSRSRFCLYNIKYPARRNSGYGGPFCVQTLY